MIPPDISLYTWLDVEEVLLRFQERDNLPNWLIWAQAYWDSLTIGILSGTDKEVAKSWLKEIYDPRFQVAKEDEIAKGIDGLIILESLLDKQKVLPIIFEETVAENRVNRLVPSLARPTVIVSNSHQGEFPASFSPDFPSIVAFHSFKGGVGRTTNALVFAQALTASNYKVLLIDGDMEAPGISWLLEQRLPSPPVAFADLIALVHGDPDPEARDSIQLVAEKLQNALLDNIYVLPAFRSTRKFSALEIRPEHLIQGAANAFILTQILADLGKVLGVDVVIVDLRAGLSELSTGLILDPRVYRIFVTTLSGQSISGTAKLLELLGEKAPSTRNTDPLPTIIISQVPDEIQNTELFSNQEKILLESAKAFTGEDLEPLILITRFIDSLQVLPTTWEEVITKLKRSGSIDFLHPLLDILPKKINQNTEEKTLIPKDGNISLKSQREKFTDFTHKLIFAETIEDRDFLPTIPLRHLASDNRHQVPISIVVGAKGSGKTYTFLQIVSRENWQTFAQDACGGEVQIQAAIFPILEPTNSTDNWKTLIKKVREKTARSLGFATPLTTNEVRDYIRDSLSESSLHEGQWRERWLDIIAWGMGFQPEEPGAGRLLAGHLSEIQQRLLLVIDGLEDIFQDFATKETQQTALRALLQDVPEWLGLLPGRPLGILIFVRRDMVIAAIRQNAAQMIARYEPYALKWDREESLRLVAWIAMRLKIIDDVEKLQDMREEDLTQVLQSLWGKKLGSANSREAGSARFVLAALSDFKGQIQARDLVRLLYLAAKTSVNDDRWADRILTPVGIRDALSECSTKKIEEIEAENTALKVVFNKLRKISSKKRIIPFTREEIQLSVDDIKIEEIQLSVDDIKIEEIQLSVDDIKILEENGVILREKDDYYMPEIFRLGLDFSLSANGRPAVMSLARRAAKQGN